MITANPIISRLKSEIRILPHEITTIMGERTITHANNERKLQSALNCLPCTSFGHFLAKIQLKFKKTEPNCKKEKKPIRMLKLKIIDDK